MKKRLRYLTAAGIFAASLTASLGAYPIAAFASEVPTETATEAPAPQTEAPAPQTEAPAPQTETPAPQTEKQTEKQTEAPTPQTEKQSETPSAQTEAQPDQTEKQTEMGKQTVKETETEKTEETEETEVLPVAPIEPSFSMPVNPNNYPMANINEVTNDLYSFLRKEMKLNHAAACGVLANVHLESDFNLFALGDGGSSYGLCQWHNGRWASLAAFCRNNGYDPDTLDGQANYLKHELEGGYINVYNYLLSVPDTAQGSYDAAYYFCVYFEAPAQTASRAAQRGNLARNEYYPRTYKLSDDYASVISGMRGTKKGAPSAEIDSIREDAEPKVIIQVEEPETATTAVEESPLNAIEDIRHSN